MIRGIILLDRRNRVRIGRYRGTNGLMARLAKEFGVTVWCIQRIAWREKRTWKGVRASKIWWGSYMR